MVREKYIYIGAVILSLVLFSCSDDDDGDSYPSVQTELVEAITGDDKNVKEILLDNGTKYAVSQSISATSSDTVYRCVCTYGYDAKTEKLSVYTLKVIPSSYPIQTDSLPSNQSGPYKLISNWVSNRYINTYLSYQTTSQGDHRFLFVEDSISHHPDGSRCAYVRLYHETPLNDPGSYSQKQYVSFPTYYYQGKTDTIHLEIGGKTLIALP